MKHVASLDGVRGVAVLSVVLFHFFPRSGTGPFGMLASAGWIGVDIFFVLSGFLITTILYEQRGAENYFRNFYVRRVLRLFPLYYFLLLGALLLAPFLHVQWRLGHLAMLFYGANLVLPFDNSLGTIGPFDFFHVWSLAVEEQFYLVWPWLVGSQLKRGTLRNICIAGILLSPLLRFALLHVHAQPWLIYQSLPTRMDSLLVGAALALIPLPSLRTARITGAAALAVCSVLVWLGHSMFFLSRPIQGAGYSALALLSGSILVLSFYPTTIVHRVCSWNVLRFYGKYSYGLYLWHYLFLAQFGWLAKWVREHVPVPFVAGVLSFGSILLCSTLLAVASYRLIERPFLQLKRRFEY
ncbi:MAG TPA: acyltransferase [Edaphobacter sp.]|nr:acyltransferase [Edaphobacter sp.]